MTTTHLPCTILGTFFCLPSYSACNTLLQPQGNEMYTLTFPRNTPLPPTALSGATIGLYSTLAVIWNWQWLWTLPQSFCFCPGVPKPQLLPFVPHPHPFFSPLGCTIEVMVSLTLLIQAKRNSIPLIKVKQSKTKKPVKWTSLHLMLIRKEKQF